MDYLKYYNLEEYLFETVSPRFRENNYLSAFDFLSIVIWKSPRPKRMILDGLRERGQMSLGEAVRDLTYDVHQAEDHETRLKILLDRPGIGLAMATAILTVLYPKDFTVYDKRVCESLRDLVPQSCVRSFKNLGNRSPATIWGGYMEFLKAVREYTPRCHNLRDKDRWLWARAMAKQTESEIKSGN